MLLPKLNHRTKLSNKEYPPEIRALVKELKLIGEKTAERFIQNSYTMRRKQPARDYSGKSLTSVFMQECISYTEFDSRVAILLLDKPRRH